MWSSFGLDLLPRTSDFKATLRQMGFKIQYSQRSFVQSHPLCKVHIGSFSLPVTSQPLLFVCPYFYHVAETVQQPANLGGFIPI